MSRLLVGVEDVSGGEAKRRDRRRREHGDGQAAPYQVSVHEANIATHEDPGKARQGHRQEQT